jgi:hypothetical protein
LANADENPAGIEADFAGDDEVEAEIERDRAEFFGRRPSARVAGFPAFTDDHVRQPIVDGASQRRPGRCRRRLVPARFHAAGRTCRGATLL